MYEQDYRALTWRCLTALAVGLLAVVVCYYWIDRPVAYFVHERGIERIAVFKWLTYPPPLVQTWSPVVLALVMIRRAWGALARWQFVLLVSCLSLIVADEFRTSLGDACGRYWPETWFHDNPSLIGNGTYGFHPFQRGDDIGSFPSGHATRILGFASVWWIAIRHSRPPCVVLALLMLVSLVAMDYHFVSDVIAGGVLGAVVGAYAARLASLDQPA